MFELRRSERNCCRTDNIGRPNGKEANISVDGLTYVGDDLLSHTLSLETARNAISNERESSREAAKECSPRRKSWGSDVEKCSSSEGAKETAVAQTISDGQTEKAPTSLLMAFTYVGNDLLSHTLSLESARNAISNEREPSREAAKECSPRRKSWGSDVEKCSAPKERKKL